MSMNIKSLFRRSKGLTIDDIVSRSVSSSRRSGGGLSFGFLNYGGGRSFRQENAMHLPAVYRCVELISDSVAQLPLKIFAVDSKGFRTEINNHPLCHLLNCEPNPRMTAFVFKKTLVTATLLGGNGYAYVQRDGAGEPIGLHYIPNEYVTIVRSDRLDMPVTYSIGTAVDIAASNMLHILNYSADGVEGVSTITHAAETLGVADAAEKQAKGFFDNGCNVGDILTIEGALTQQQLTDAQESWRKAFGTGGAPNGVAVLQANMRYQPISVNPKDAMLLESRQFSVIDICRFFGVSPTKVFDLSKSSYNTLEQTNLSFLSDTLAPILKKIELEIERKLFPREKHQGIEVRFDTNQLLRGDKAAQAQFYNTLFSIGAITPNEIRREVDLPPLEGGNTTFVQVNLQTLDRAVNPPEPVTELPPANDAGDGPEDPDDKADEKPDDENKTT